MARHELLDPYEFFWRIDHGVEIHCDMDNDPMMVMKVLLVQESSVQIVPDVDCRRDSCGKGRKTSLE